MAVILPALHCVHESPPPSAASYQPAVQGVQTVKPALSVTDPEAHDVHDVPPPFVESYVPAAQSVHTERPELAATFPLGQSVHELAPGEDEIFPGEQLEHVAVDVAAVDEEYLPTTQLVHPPTPVEDLYLPAAHVVQVLSELGSS